MFARLKASTKKQSPQELGWKEVRETEVSSMDQSEASPSWMGWASESVFFLETHRTEHRSLEIDEEEQFAFYIRILLLVRMIDIDTV